MNKYGRFAVVFLFTGLLVGGSLNAYGQRRDYMTDAEIELVREAQDIDLRIDVLTKMIDRRLEAAGISAGGEKIRSKDSDKWGEAPKGTRLQLLGDVRSLLQKAIDDVDDVAEHNDNTQTQNKTEGLLFPKAVRALAAAAQRYRTALAPIAQATRDEREKGLLLASIESCGDIIEAAQNLPPEKPKTKH
ncbi:MAG: hypothetical protein ABI539_03415 [Acidobacteriota bacterium]